MNKQHGDGRYWSTPIEDRKQGFAGLRLHREARGSSTPVAEMIFWDAVGQFTLQTLNTDVPVEIIEALIAETRATILTS